MKALESMRRRYFSGLAAITICLMSSALWAKEAGMITREQLVEMFAQIARDTDWDLAKPMLWGYFFTDSDKTKLQRVTPLLEQQGYRFVEIFQTEKEDPDEPDMWWLHVEKVEVHTPTTLDQRNQKLYRFADEHHLDTYDGMDVGPVQKPN